MASTPVKVSVQARNLLFIEYEVRKAKELPVYMRIPFVYLFFFNRPYNFTAKV